MSATIYVTPAEGLVVRDPDTREALPAVGAWVPRSTYWLRRLRDGDVTEAKPPPADEAAEDEGAGRKSSKRGNR